MQSPKRILELIKIWHNTYYAYMELDTGNNYLCSKTIFKAVNLDNRYANMYVT